MAVPVRQTQTATTHEREAVRPALLDSVIDQTLRTAEAEREIRPFMPDGVDYERVIALARSEAERVPTLKKCTPASIIRAVAKIMQWGLEVGETAYLVPFYDTTARANICTPVRSYLGDIELLHRNRVARRVDARCVYSNEPFTYREGTDALLEHQPLAPSVRGKLIGAYAIVWQTFTHSAAEFLYLEDINATRKKYSKQWTQEKVGDCPPWYAKKCAVRAATKLLPKSPKLAAVLRAFADEEASEAPAPLALAIGDAVEEDDRPAHITPDGEDLDDAEAEASEAQYARLDAIERDERVGVRTRQKIAAAMQKGHVTAERAAKWIGWYDEKFTGDLSALLDAPRERNAAEEGQ